MFQRQVTIQNPVGIHARPAALLVQFCKQFDNPIVIQSGQTEVNPKSIISVLAGEMKQGVTVTVRVDGDDAQSVGEQVAAFLEQLQD